MDKALIWCVIVLSVPIGIMVICRLWDKLIDYMFKPTPYSYQQSFSKRVNGAVDRTTKRKVLGRKHPPCATFFSKVDGRERQVDGPYEEKWLTGTEKWNWRVRRNK